jgi:hypothetical protein
MQQATVQHEVEESFKLLPTQLSILLSNSEYASPASR